MARLALWLPRHQQILFAANLNPLSALLIRDVRQWNRNAENANRLANGLVCGEREDNFKTDDIELTTNSVKDNRNTNQLYRITKTIQAANSHNKKSVSFYVTTDEQWDLLLIAVHCFYSTWYRNLPKNHQWNDWKTPLEKLMTMEHRLRDKY